MRKVRTSVTAIGVLCAAVILYAFAVEPYLVALHTVSVALPELGPRTVRILHLSDLHMGSPGWRESRVRDLAGRCQPDLIAFTGDLVSRAQHVPEACGWLGNLSSLAPVYAVPGNYAYRVGGERYLSELSRAGVVLLRNRAVQVRLDGAQFWLLGVDDPSSTRSRLEDAVAQIQGTGPRILLAHFPTIVEQASYYGIELVLAGHTHGGQIRVPGIGAVFPFRTPLLKRYQMGLYKLGDTTMYVTSGVGTTVIPARFLCRPEIVLLVLRGGNLPFRRGEPAVPG